MERAFIAGIKPPKERSGAVWWWVFRENTLLVHETMNGTMLPHTEEIAALGIDPVRTQYLGMLGEHHCFAVEVATETEPPPEMRFEVLRALYGRLPDDLFALAGRAVQIIAWDRTRADAIVLAAGSHNVQLQPVLVYTPAWSNAGGMTEPPSNGDFAGFVSAVVGRYHTTIHDWELWNEPDGPTYWKSNEQAYVSSILIPGYQAAKSADPQTRVILGGPAYVDAQWLDGIYNLGGGNSFDIMAWHDYQGGDFVLNDARAIEGILSAHGQSGKPIWLGEYGAQENVIADTNQQTLLRQVLTATGTPIAVAQWYNLRDDYSVGCCPMQPGEPAHWGLVQHDDLTKKDAFATLRQLIAAG